MESHLVHLQRQVDQLAQAQQKEQSQVLERATQLLDKIEQKHQLQNLERQLQQLQGADSKSAAPKSSDGELTTDAAAKSAEPVLKAEPSTGDGELLNLTIEDAEITEVLKMLGEISGTNILVGANVKGKVTARLQNVNVEQALVGILRSLGFVFEREGRFIFVMTAADADARRKAGRKIITKVYRPNYISVADLQALVTPLITPQVGKVAITAPAEIGIKSSKEEAGGNRIAQQDALLVQDYGEVIQEVDNLIVEMDVPPMQVVIETMILNVKLDDTMEFGVNFALLSGNNKELFLNGNGRTLGTSSGFPGAQDSIVPAAGQFLADTAGLKFGFLRGDMSGFINAIESIADTSVLAAPQLRVINKQKAELIIGKQLSYTTSTFNQTQTIENVQFLDVGIKLILRPFIAPDGMVRMEIHPERSSGGINPTTQLPDKETTEVTTNVMVRDGSTVVIGGLIEEKTDATESRVPLIGAIPVVGNLFKNKKEVVSRNELIVLITPRIVVEPTDAIEGQEAHLEHEERAAHLRENLSPVNRLNLTRMEYERAFALYQAGDLVRARTHVYRALRLQKTNAEAIRLRNQIENALHENTKRLLTLRPPLDPSQYPDAAPADGTEQPTVVEPLPATEEAGPALDLKPTAPDTSRTAPRLTPVPSEPGETSPAVPPSPANLPPLPNAP
ncbi:MAG: hypothetical protein AB7O26_06750 [Planctomycetaceae bacterium]